MSPYSVSGAKPQLPNVFLDIIGGLCKHWMSAVIFSVICPKSGGTRTPRTPSKLRLWSTTCYFRDCKALFAIYM